MPDTTITAAEAVKHFSKAEIAVQVVKTDGKSGTPLRNEAGHIVTEMKPLAAAHVIAARDLGDSVSIVTIDGRKHQAAKSDKAAK